MAERLDKSLQDPRASLAAAEAELDAAEKRAPRAEAKDMFRELKAFVGTSLSAGTELVKGH